MTKINDRIILGVISGIIGGVVITLIDYIFLQIGVVKTSLHELGARIYVSRREAKTPLGKLLGIIISMGFSVGGGLIITQLLTRLGKDRLIAKGIFTGVTSGAIIPGLLSALDRNKIRPKDAQAHLSYTLGHAVYGIIVILSCIKLGHPSLFDEPPLN